MKTFFRRLTLPAGLRRKWVVMPAFGVLVLAILGGLWFLGHSGANTVWNQPSVPISDVLDRVDRGEIATASISGQRILLIDTAGRQSWTIEKESSMGSTEQYLRSHHVKVAVQSTDETSVATVLPNLLGLLVLLALLCVLLRRSYVISSSTPRRMRPASSSSMRSTRSAAGAAARRSGPTKNANRPSTSCWSRWTASIPIAPWL